MVSLKKPGYKSAKQILVSKLDLTHQGEESTVFRFNLDDEANLVTGSVHNLPKKLRNRKS